MDVAVDRSVLSNFRYLAESLGWECECNLPMIDLNIFSAGERQLRQ
jgi:hypothetical protein